MNLPDYAAPVVDGPARTTICIPEEIRISRKALFGHGGKCMVKTSPLTDLKQQLGLKARDVWFLPCYALGFYLLHQAARPWAGAGYFSLWYPAARRWAAWVWG